MDRRKLTRRLPLVLGTGLFGITLVVLAPILILLHRHALAQVEARSTDLWLSEHRQWSTDLSQAFARMEHGAEALARSASQTIDHVPAEADDAEWDALMERGTDGIWRSRRAGFAAADACGIWVPPYAGQDRRQRAEYLAIARTVADFGRGAIDGVCADAFVMPADGANVVLWPDNGDYVFKTGLEMDYRRSDWMRVAEPAANPAGRARWTPPTYDPAAKAWWVGVAAPIRRAGAYAGVAGHDAIAQRLFADLSRFRLLSAGTNAIVIGDRLIFSPQFAALLDQHRGEVPIGGLPGGAGELIRTAMAQPPTGEAAAPLDGFLVVATRLGGPGLTLVSVLDRSTTAAVSRRQLASYQTASLSTIAVLLVTAILLAIVQGRRQAADEQELRTALLAANASRDEAARLNAELERRVAERTAELTVSNRELESFSYSVSHDLRAPLRAIDGFADAIAFDLGERLDPENRRLFGRIRAATQRMGRLIDDLLILGRVSRSGMSRTGIDLTAMAQEVVALLRQGDPERQAVTVIAEDMRVTGDPGLVRVVLDNLLGNAWKFTGRTPGARISVALETVSGATWVVIADNGAGFDMTYADKLFGTFQRLHDVGDFPGTGIGLATVARIVQRHGGQVTARGEVGAGATFRFTLGC